MGNEAEEIKILDCEIEKTELSLKETVTAIDELNKEDSKHLENCQIFPNSEAFLKSEIEKIESNSKSIEVHRHAIEVLQSKLNTLKQSRGSKLNAIVFRGNREENVRQNKETEELKRRAVELGTKYVEPQAQGTSSKKLHTEGFLDDANNLRIGESKNLIKLSPSQAELIRFMARELSSQKCAFLEMQHILTYHYGLQVMSKIFLSKKERHSFDQEKGKIDRRCKKTLHKDLIKSLGDKKYTLSINIKLPKNSPKDSPF